MKYQIIFTKFLDVPKNVATEIVTTSEEDAIKVAKSKLLKYNADTSIIVKLESGTSKVIHRFEQVKK